MEISTIVFQGRLSSLKVLEAYIVCQFKKKSTLKLNKITNQKSKANLVRRNKILKMKSTGKARVKGL